MEGTAQPGGIRRGPKGGGIQGWGGTFRDSRRLKPLQGAGGHRRGWHWVPARLVLVGGSSRLRMGGNGASRLTLTITLGEEKAFGCNGYFSPGPWSGGGYCPFFYFRAAP